MLNVYDYNFSPSSGEGPGEVHFYVVFRFGTDGTAQLAAITKELSQRYPDYRFRLAPHPDISD